MIANILNLPEDKLLKLVSWASVTTAGLIIMAKLLAYIMTDSLSIFASLIDSLFDIAASAVNVVAMYYALQPPDNEHRFGHGKAEDLAVFTQSAFFGASGFFVAVAAVKRVIFPQIIHQEIVGIVIMWFSIFLTVCLVVFQRYVMNRIKSSIIAADNFHYITDLLTNVLTIVGLYITMHTSIAYIDALFALAMSFYIIFGAFLLLRKAFRNLMDHEFSDEDKAIVIEIIKSHKNIIGFHDLKTRYSGSRPIIQFHLEMNGNMSLRDAHNISNEIQTSIIAKMPNADIIIHQDPEDINEDKQYID